jgi:hypothetical protein
MRQHNKNNQGSPSQETDENLTETKGEEFESLDEASDSSLEKFSLPFNIFRKKYPKIPKSDWNKQRREGGLTTRSIVGKASNIPSADLSLPYEEFSKKYEGITTSQHRIQREKHGLATERATRRNIPPADLERPFQQFTLLHPGISPFQWQQARRIQGLASNTNLGKANVISPADLARSFDDFHKDYPDITEYQYTQARQKPKGKRAKVRVAKRYKTGSDLSSEPMSREPSPAAEPSGAGNGSSVIPTSQSYDDALEGGDRGGSAYGQAGSSTGGVPQQQWTLADLTVVDAPFDPPRSLSQRPVLPTFEQPGASSSLGSKRPLDLNLNEGAGNPSKRARREGVYGGESRALSSTAMGGGNSWDEQQVNRVRTTVQEHVTTLQGRTAARRTRANAVADAKQAEARSMAVAGLQDLARNHSALLTHLLGDESFTESERGTLSRYIESDGPTRAYVLENARNLAIALGWPSEGLGVGLAPPNPAPTATTDPSTSWRPQEWVLSGGSVVNALDYQSTVASTSNAMPPPSEINIGVGELPENVHSRSDYAQNFTQPIAQEMILEALPLENIQDGYYKYYYGKLSADTNYIGPVRAELKNPLLRTIITENHRMGFNNAASDVENSIQESHLFEHRRTEGAGEMSSIASMGQPPASSATAPPSSLSSSHLPPPNIGFDSSSIQNWAFDAEGEALFSPNAFNSLLPFLPSDPLLWDDNLSTNQPPSLSANQTPAGAPLPPPPAQEAEVLPDDDFLRHDVWVNWDSGNEGLGAGAGPGLTANVTHAPPPIAGERGSLSPNTWEALVSFDPKEAAVESYDREESYTQPSSGRGGAPGSRSGSPVR